MQYELEGADFKAILYQAREARCVSCLNVGSSDYIFHTCISDFMFVSLAERIKQKVCIRRAMRAACRGLALAAAIILALTNKTLTSQG
jgi:hypothetical protein